MWVCGDFCLEVVIDVVATALFSLFVASLYLPSSCIPLAAHAVSLDSNSLFTLYSPCRQFTPDLVSFYNKMNSRRGKENKFQIVWVSRCRDMNSFGQYFTHMNWLALPFEEAMGQRGQWLSQKYKVKGIPHLALVDEVGNLIANDARNKIPQDKAGIGFPWRNPLAQLYITLVPKSFRLMLKSQVSSLKDSVVGKLKGGGMKKSSRAATA